MHFIRKNYVSIFKNWFLKSCISWISLYNFYCSMYKFNHMILYNFFRIFFYFSYYVSTKFAISNNCRNYIVYFCTFRKCNTYSISIKVVGLINPVIYYYIRIKRGINKSSTSTSCGTAMVWKTGMNSRSGTWRWPVKRAGVTEIGVAWFMMV